MIALGCEIYGTVENSILGSNVIVEKGALVNTLLLQEDIAKGQRVESFTVEGFENGEWRKLCSGTTIGYKRLLRFDECHPERLRITITQTRSTANIKSVGLYYAEPIAK